MKYNPEIHHRRSIRLKGYNYSRSGAYFITTCVQNREYLFGEIKNGQMITNQNGNIVTNCWFDLINHYEDIVLDIFVVMPNHFHGIIVITGKDDNDINGCDATVGANHVRAIHELPLHEFPRQRRKMLLSKIMGRFKMVTSKQINLSRKTPGVPVWQRNYYEHIIRNEESYNEIAEYICTNPLKWKDDRYYA